MSHFLLAVWTLWQRELVRFYRQPSRVVGALAPPVLFWLLIGFGWARRSTPRAPPPAPATWRTSSPGRHPHSPVHRDLLRDLDHRGPARGVSPGGAGCAGAARRRGARQGARRHDAGPAAERAVPPAGPRYRAPPLVGRRAGGSGGRAVPARLRAHGAGLRHRLVARFHPRLPRHHEPVPDPDVAPGGYALSRRGSARVAGRGDAGESPHVRSGRPAPGVGTGRRGRPPGFGVSLGVTAVCAALAFGAAVWVASRRPTR